VPITAVCKSESAKKSKQIKFLRTNLNTALTIYICISRHYHQFVFRCHRTEHIKAWYTIFYHVTDPTNTIHITQLKKQVHGKPQNLTSRHTKTFNQSSPKLAYANMHSMQNFIVLPWRVSALKNANLQSFRLVVTLFWFLQLITATTVNRISRKICRQVSFQPWMSLMTVIITTFNVLAAFCQKTAILAPILSLDRKQL